MSTALRARSYCTQLIRKMQVNTSKLEKKFNVVYDQNLFCGQESLSGGGSNLIQTKIIREEIPALIKKMDIKYLLTTTFTTRNNNEDLGEGFWRPLNLQLYPFHFPAPVAVINEGCTEDNNQYTDKSLGLWLLSDITVLNT